jgi:hypothetical protein
VRSSDRTNLILDTYLNEGKLVHVGHWGVASSCYCLSDSISHWRSTILEGFGYDPPVKWVFFALLFWFVHIGCKGPLGGPGGYYQCLFEMIREVHYEAGIIVWNFCVGNPGRKGLSAKGGKYEPCA